MAIKKWVAVNDGINTKILTDNDPSKVSVYEIDLVEPEDTAQVAELGGWLDLVNKVDKGAKNVYYNVLDMAGVEGFVDNEPSMVYVNSNGTAYVPKEKIYSKAPNALKMLLPTPRTYTSTTTAGATPSINFGDIETDTIRDEFFKGAVIDVQYGFHRGSVFHRGTIISKTGDGANPGDNMIIEGYKFENNKFESFTLTVGTAGITNENYIPFKGSGFEFDTIKLPAAYADTEALPKASIEQLILNNNALLTTDAADPTWGDLDGTQSTQFNPAQIVITLTDSGLVVDDNIQLLLGSNVGTMVLDGAVKIYGNVADASRNGNVAGQYKWYAYAVSATEVKFVMEDSKSSLTDQTQTISKIRRVSPNLQKFTGHYTSQADILKGAVNITGVNTGTSQEITLPAGLTTDKLTGIALTVSGSTDWYEVEGWDKVSAFYISVSNEASNQIWWVEYKIEAVPSDNTKLKITNFKSGNVGTDNATYNAHWMAFKGGK